MENRESGQERPRWKNKLVFSDGEVVSAELLPVLEGDKPVLEAGTSGALVSWKASFNEPGGERGGEAAATAAASIPPREACKLLHGPATSQEQSEPRRQPGSQEQLQLPLLGKEEEEEEERGGTDSATSPRLALEPDSPAKRAPGVPVAVGSASEADR